jgi:hypothetical protein
MPAVDGTHVVTVDRFAIPVEPGKDLSFGQFATSVSPFRGTSSADTSKSENCSLPEFNLTYTGNRKPEKHAILPLP